MAWSKYRDESWMKQDVHTFSCDNDSVYHQINVFTSLEEHHGRKLTQHVASVRAGAYGETLYEVTLPFHTKIKDARATAIKLAQQANADGNAVFVL